MNKKRKILLTLGIGIGIIVILSFGVTFARYAYNTAWNYYLKSKNFYLESDKLSLNGNRFVDTSWDGSPIHFNLKNSLNESYVSDYDINYEVVCEIKNSDSSKCFLNGTGKSTYQGVLSNYEVCVNNKNDGLDVKNYNKNECLTANYEWQNQETLKDMYFEIEGDDNSSDIEVLITVKSISPYKKTLSSEFILSHDKTLNKVINYDYKDNGLKGNLVFTNAYEKDKCVRISWDSEKYKVNIDKEKAISFATDANGYINEIELRIKAQDSFNLDFYKSKNEGGSKEDFSLETVLDC